MKLSRCGVLLALAGACTSSAFGDVFGFESAAYVPGSGINGVVDPNGSTWQKEGTELGDFVVDSAVFSPRANPLVGGVSTKSLRYDYDGGAAANIARLGLDLATQLTTGIVTVQYDVRNGVRSAGSNSLRVNVMNRANIPVGGPANTDEVQWQPYVANDGGGAGRQLAFLGIVGGTNINSISVMDQSPYSKPAFAPQAFYEATGTDDNWYRVRMWFNMDDAANPGRLLYLAIYEISCNSEILVGEHHIANQASPLWKNVSAAAPNAVRSVQLRALGSGTADATVDQRMWIDNLVIAADPSFVAPSPVVEPPAVAPTTLNVDAGSQEVTTAFMLPANVGSTPSLARVGTTVYTMDGNNGLTTWTGGPSSTFTDDAAEVAFDNDGTGVMVADTNGDLYLVANRIGSAGAGYRDLLRYDSGAGTWVMVCDADGTGGNSGNHSASLLTFAGKKRVFHAWNGAMFYPALNTDGTRSPTIGGVGNRWAGACTEGFPHGTSGSVLYYLQQTDANGVPISTLQMQAFNAIYRLNFNIGCDNGTGIRTRVSATARNIPWQTNAADGGAVNRHQMEFEPARNRIWVLRAGATNEIGIYDIAQDRYGVLRLTRSGNPLPLTKADILLSADGSQMYLMSQGEGSVLAVSTNVTIADRGACCNGTTCTVALQPDCLTGGGVFKGANTACQDYTVGANAGGAFEDIAATGTAVTLNDDDSTTVPIGFSFTHFGNTYTDVRVGANGYLSFSGGDGTDSWTPNFGATEPNNMVAGFWTDLSPQLAPGNVKYQVLGAAPTRRLIVQWTQVSRYHASTPVNQNTFQIVLFEGSNNSEVRFGTLEELTQASPQPWGSGVENVDGSHFRTLANSAIQNNTNHRYTPAPNPCACPADFNGVDGVTVADIFAFLTAWFAGNPAANFNGVDGVTVADIFAFLTAWFAGC